MSWRRLATAALVSSGIAVAGYRAGTLTGRGACAATAAGTSVLAGFGARGGLLLGLFFVSGSGLSRLPASQRHEAGSTARNERQVLANGGVAAAAPLMLVAGHRESAIAALAGSLAAATSDTWATEIGLQFDGRPRYLVTNQPARAGLSGGVTRAGTLGSIGGSVALASVAALSYRDARLFVTTTTAGLTGSISDSLLGELVQAKWQAGKSSNVLERQPGVGWQGSLVSGIRWVDNDAVNLACTLIGGLAGLALWSLATAGD